MRQNEEWRKAIEPLIKRLSEALDPVKNRGAKARFIEKTGIERSTIDRLLRGEHAPNIDTLNTIAAWLGLQLWEIFQPPGATPTPAPTPLTTETVLAFVELRLLATDKLSRDELVTLATLKPEQLAAVKQTLAALAEQNAVDCAPSKKTP